MTLTVEQILSGTTVGRMQSAGQMDVVPLLDGGSAQDESFAPPRFEAGTQGYGRVRVRNLEGARTILPTAAAFVTSEAAQDHAVPGASLVRASETRDLENAYCVQQTQGGYIQQREREFTILPAALRAHALSHRRERSYQAMWPHISAFRSSYGDHGQANLVEFLKRFERELDEFVAQFEIVPGQVGAVVLVGGKVVGVERAPNVAFWRALWKPLVRVCYGSLALKAGLERRTPPATRAPLGAAASIQALGRALADAREATARVAASTVGEVSRKALSSAPEEERDAARVLTLASPEYAGQAVLAGGRTVYASVCLAAA